LKRLFLGVALPAAKCQVFLCRETTAAAPQSVVARDRRSSAVQRSYQDGADWRRVAQVNARLMAGTPPGEQAGADYGPNTVDKSPQPWV
jgi:hypothetical protein